ncbi:MAG: peptide chain release factor N(5)-glutamine methyltransferase [Deltaproteobacteria bacterium]
MHLRELYQYGKENMSLHSIENPGLETSLLLTRTGAINSISEIYTSPEKEVERYKVVNFHGLLDRRIRREPMAYLIGEKEFYSRPFSVNRSVLIPRPETELLVEQAVRAADGTRDPVILDIGTGSGCISVTIACEVKDSGVYATDVSREALSLAHRNAIRHGARDRIHFINCNLSDPLKEESFDVIVSNPPYIPESEFPFLERDVKDHEPGISLIGGEDGLLYIRKIISTAGSLLKDGGWCLLEVGAGQASRAKELFEEHGFHETSSVKDLANIERVIKARWKK